MSRDSAKDKAMCEAATPGPWSTWARGEIVSQPPDDFEHVLWADARFRDVQIKDADAHFIAEARQALPYWITQYEIAENQRQNEVIECITFQQIAEQQGAELTRLRARVRELEAAALLHTRPDVATVPEHDSTLEELFKTTGCIQCNGLGYFEYATGVEYGMYKETVKEPCDCVLKRLEGNA